MMDLNFLISGVTMYTKKIYPSVVHQIIHQKNTRSTMCDCMYSCTEVSCIGAFPSSPGRTIVGSCFFGLACVEVFMSLMSVAYPTPFLCSIAYYVTQNVDFRARNRCFLVVFQEFARRLSQVF